LEGRALHAAARIAAIVVTIPIEPPPFMGLALDIGFGRLALSIERVEVLFEAGIGGDASVDRAAQD
jgi:hypothetical protein